MYRIAGGLGRFGVISPLSEHFCDTCNRLRITSDGKLRTCLFSEREYRLRPLLRNSKLGLEKVRQVIALALRNKPLGYEVLNPGAVPEARDMAVICRMRGFGSLGIRTVSPRGMSEPRSKHISRGRDRAGSSAAKA